MINNRKLIVDNFCEIVKLLLPLADDTFYDFAEHDLVPGAIYVFSRQQLWANISTVKQLVEDKIIQVILANPAEGADTMFWPCKITGLFDLVREQKVLLVTGGLFHDANIPALLYEHFLVQIHNYKENHAAINQYQANGLPNRPYKFLFLNGRVRTHRKYLLERFRKNGLLDQSIWTNLDSRISTGFRYVEWYEHEDPTQLQHTPDSDFVKSPFPIRVLPPEYEVDRYRARSESTAPESNEDMHIKRHLFDREWGEIYLEARPYLDTYFSLVTETTFDYPCSFRTEKIWKPVAMGHPWIAVGNAGYYRDMHNLGFKTFGHLIDETFDSIDIPQDRCARIAQVVEDLCQQDLRSFLTSASDVCKHNQERIKELHLQLPQQFLPRFVQFVTENFA